MTDVNLNMISSTKEILFEFKANVITGVSNVLQHRSTTVTVGWIAGHKFKVGTHL
jgi:hypothetical protein